MFSGASLPPRSSGFLKSTTYPGQEPASDLFAGQGCVDRNFRTGAGFCEICPFTSRTQLVHLATRWLCGPLGSFVLDPSWAFISCGFTSCAFRTAQPASTNVPI